MFIGIQILVPTLVRPQPAALHHATFPINQTTAQPVPRHLHQRRRCRDLPRRPAHTAGRVGDIRPAGGGLLRPGGRRTHPPRLLPGPRRRPRRAKAGGPDVDQIAACLANYNLHESVTYQPASHYWPLQWFETGIFLVLAGALSGFCFWRIRRRQN